jgi:hypothetical protein
MKASPQMLQHPALSLLLTHVLTLSTDGDPPDELYIDRSPTAAVSTYQSSNETRGSSTPLPPRKSVTFVGRQRKRLCGPIERLCGPNDSCALTGVSIPTFSSHSTLGHIGISWQKHDGCVFMIENRPPCNPRICSAALQVPKGSSCYCGRSRCLRECQASRIRVSALT